MISTRSSSRGLALVEVLVISGLGLLALALALRAIHAAQIFAKRARAENNIEIIGLAMHNYHDAIGVFGMSAVASENEKLHGVGHSGFTALLPFMEQTRLYNAYNFDLEPWHAANNTSTRARV